MKTLGHRFGIGQGLVMEEGKAHHPDFLRLHLPRDEAFTFALNILRQLEHPRPNDAPTLEICLFGEWERNVEDDLDSSK